MIVKIPRAQLPRRPFQHAIERAVLAAAARPSTDDPADRTVVVDVHPGSGKTRGYLTAADALVEAGVIDAVVVLTPRLNLARQAETDWEALRAEYASVMGRIAQRDNRLPLLRDRAYGYATTYQSLLANPDIHEAFCRGRRVLLVLDEAQGLGDETPEGLGTRSAVAVRGLGRLARLIVVLSGTPSRGDGAPLLFARYAPADATGWCPLVADVHATYQDGVAGRYLRTFEAELVDGTGCWSPFAAAPDAAPETLELATLRAGLARLIGQPGYWEALVDRGVARVATLRRDLDPRLQGLIAAADQTQAKEVCAYLAREHPGVRVLLATQDETLAHRNLDAFREGKADMLITCAMAHVGYDCAPIAVVVALTTIRQEAWLRQLIARGLRVMEGLDPDAQCCHIVVPDDPQMRAFVERLRSECAAGLLARPPREAGPGGDGEAPSGARAGVGGTGIGLGAHATGRRVRGLDPAGDADDAELRPGRGPARGGRHQRGRAGDAAGHVPAPGGRRGRRRRSRRARGRHRNRPTPRRPPGPGHRPGARGGVAAGVRRARAPLRRLDPRARTGLGVRRDQSAGEGRPRSTGRRLRRGGAARPVGLAEGVLPRRGPAARRGGGVMEPRLIGNRALNHEELLRLNLHADAHVDGVDPGRFLAQLAQAVRERAWERLMDEDGHPLDFRTFLAAPYPVGIGADVELVRRLLTLPQRREVLPEHAAAMATLREEVERLLLTPLPPHGKGAKRRGGVASSNTTPPPVGARGGTGREYTIRRLRRDAPELAERVLRGELSANAAAIQAGIRPRPTPLAAALLAWRRLDPVEQAAFLTAVGGADRAERDG